MTALGPLFCAGEREQRGWTDGSGFILSPQLERGHLFGVGPLGASTLPVSVSPPPEGRGMEKLVLEPHGEREDHFCFPLGSRVTESRTAARGLREEARGRRQRGSDTSSCFEGARPVICLQPHLSYHQPCFFRRLLSATLCSAHSQFALVKGAGREGKREKE
uniref:Uncharacterized protein n=1 Tax=Pipistrellus kuhlii TaxID=59472 RepID=A0A7J7VN23_PIPKU|nr:hypothetical protein mPipKuh1_008413 [Pipistrellus kuhlii]